jgi:hypothetical protein
MEYLKVHLDSSMMPPINPVEEYELRDSQRRRYTIAICLFFILLLAQIVLTKYTMKQL